MAAKAAALASICFVRGFKAGFQRVTNVTPQERSAAEARLALGWQQEGYKS
jgi:hypothetical protein